MYKELTIIGSSVDELVKTGVKHIMDNGHKIQSHSGSALQANNVTYVLEDCRNRVHTLRHEKSIPYFARELLAYFCGSQNINGENGYGLVNASAFWKKICDDNGCINSNYGYYVFHQKTEEEKTQLQWIREKFVENIDTRKALININGIQHKINTKDFPCTVGLLFRIEDNNLNCDVQSRSTDVITGLPYDMGFFSVVTELLANLLSKDLNIEIKPGYVAMHANFTQIYDKTLHLAKEIINSKEITSLQYMPKIENGQELLDDIYNLGKNEPKTDFMKWCIENARNEIIQQINRCYDAEKYVDLDEKIKDLLEEDNSLEKKIFVANELLRDENSGSDQVLNSEDNGIDFKKTLKSEDVYIIS